MKDELKDYFFRPGESAMARNSSEIPRHLFSISQSQIRRDIADSERDSRCKSEGFTWFAVDEEKRGESPEAVASVLHRQMVRAKTVYGNVTLVPDYRLLCVSMAANDIATQAIFVAQVQGRLAELSQSLDKIQKREGLEQDEYWPTGTGPADYQELSRESNGIHERIFDTMYLTVLRRYQLDDVAKLYENDQAAHDQAYERGRMLVFGPVHIPPA